jgi:predicted KAP-like P-loop ATPase
MFIYDKPIETEKDDFLSRKGFSQHLGKSLLNWKEKESLVIAIYGEWGSGKSSVINLANEFIGKTNEENKPTIIEFNPWRFSEQDNLSEHFFSEIAKELEIRQESKEDKKIAEKIRIYASLLSLTPDKVLLGNFFSKTILGLGLLGISASQIIQWLNIPYDWIKYTLFIGGFLLIIIEIFKDYLIKFADFFQKKADYNKKSVLELKREIKDELIKRKKNLIVVIDDIDRLNKSEIKQIFRLIRINVDFPHTIYLLAFDRNIIEKNLGEQVGISGKDYLNKIVQVDFDIPFVQQTKISAFLFKELNRVLDVLPESVQKFFGQDDPYWANVYNSGLKDFFKNIRDVKRFASSLEFNIMQMYQGKVMEVNPIDFIALEAIRVFVPDFYVFMKSRNSLFTSTEREIVPKVNNPRKSEIEEALNKLPEDTKESIQNLITTLFPQVAGLLQYGYSTYKHEWQSSWSRNLRVCATTNFDSYFTLIPGGDEEKISQYEIENILSKTNSAYEFEKILREYIEINKIRNVLQRIQDYTEEKRFIPQSNVKNVVQALFNISDDLPEEKIGMFDFGSDMDIMIIIYQILKRESDKNNNFKILKETIPLSKSLYGPVQKVSFESPKKDEDKGSRDNVVPKDKIEELQKLCLDKIKSWQDKDRLLEQNKLIYIMYRWKEWDQEPKWKVFIDNILDDDDKLLTFVDKFVTEIRSQTIGDYGVMRIKKFNYKSLENFAELDFIKKRLEKVKTENNDLYEKNKEIIDFYLGNYDSKYEEI